MGRCFVAQPFDAGEFDKRYNQVYEPAIRAAGLEPYRVDQDPRASIPVETMISEIRSCSAFFVDITVDNPNVWFEFGLAIAYGQGVCIVCSQSRARFPFDVQHRQIIKYRTDAPADFKELRGRITARLRAILEQQNSVEAVENRLIQGDQVDADLSDVEILALTIIAGEARYVNTLASIYQVYDQMEKAGYRPVGTSVAFRRLIRRGLILQSSYEDHNHYEVDAVKLTDAGWDWIESHLDKFPMRKPVRQLVARGDLDDEIPF